MKKITILLWHLFSTITQINHLDAISTIDDHFFFAFGCLWWEKKKVRFPFNSPGSRDYTTPLCSTDVLSVEGGAEPGDDPSPAAAPLLLTRVHPYCTGRGEDRAQKANKRCGVRLQTVAMALAVPDRHGAPVSSHLIAD